MGQLRRVACAVSGGVDSAVATYLLKKKGFEVVGVFMQNWDEAEEAGQCSANLHLEDAQFVCQKLQVPFIYTNFVKEYWNEVFCDLLRGYERGVTPNPDVFCNKFIKFGHLFQFCINHLKADAMATGHYASNSWGDYLDKPLTQEAKLLKPKDNSKDQTLFLSQIPQASLQRTMFPLGSLLKSQVKNIAKEIGLEKIVLKKESTGICFIGKRNFKAFLKEYIGDSKGNFIDIDNKKVIGCHEGVHLWTIGQRILMGGLKTAYFVVDRNVRTQNIFVAQGTNHPALFSNSLIVNSPHWISTDPFTSNASSIDCQFRFQHTYDPIACQLLKISKENFEVRLSRPIRALTPGQWAVFYQREQCLGSCEILKVKNKYIGLENS